MNKYLSVLIIGSLAFFQFIGCTKDSKSGSSDSSITISGSLSTSALMTPNADNPALKMLLGLNAVQRTQCTDGYYYGVYCVSFESNPSSGEGEVDCNAGGAFAVTGMPAGAPIGCFVRRYGDASSSNGSTIGAIEVPAATLSGSSDTIVPTSSVSMTINLSAANGITATVDSGTVDTGTNAGTTFDPTSFNGVYALVCDSTSGGDLFSQGMCKCFLGDYSGTTYNNQDECMADASGAGSELVGTVEMGVELNLYNASVVSDMNMGNGNIIAAGSTIQGISVWGTSGSPGSYTTNRSGGEGVTTLGGQLDWTASPQATTAVNWSAAVSMTIKDGADADITFTLPTFVTTPNTATHGAWMTWVQAVATAAGTAGFDCTWGPSDSYAHINDGADIAKNIDCLNQVLEAMHKATEDGSSLLVPRMWIQAFCDQNGCQSSVDTTNDSARDYYNVNAIKTAHIELEDHELAYPDPWVAGADHTSIAPSTDTIGVSPTSRFVFEHFVTHGTGGGFRQSHEDERHYGCDTSGGDVQNSICDNTSAYHELMCYTNEDLAIKFMPGSGAVAYNVFFEQNQQVYWGELRKWDGATNGVVQPTGTTATDMCIAAAGGGGGTFVASAKLQP